MQEYVLAAIRNNKNQILLIEKRRGPERLIGKWNLIGGKIEPNEYVFCALNRETKEETGLVIDKWHHFLEMTVMDGMGNKQAVIFGFVGNCGDQEFVQLEDETIRWFDWHEAVNMPTLVDNLRWIVPMSEDPTILFSRVTIY